MKAKTVRQACRDREPLDGADAQCLEHALTQAESQLAARDAELAQARATIKGLRAMVDVVQREMDHVGPCGETGCSEIATCEIKRQWAAVVASREPEPAAEQTSDDEGVAPDDDSDLIPVRHIPGVGLVDAEAVEEHPAVLAGLSGRFPGEPSAAADGASEGSAFPNCPDCGEEIDPVFGRCRDPSHKPPPEPAQRGIPRTNDDGERRSNIHGKPPPEPDDVERVARDFVKKHAIEQDDHEDCDCAEALAALLRTREAAAKRQGVREGWDAASKALRGSDGSSDLADWLDARKPEDVTGEHEHEWHRHDSNDPWRCDCGARKPGVG